MGDVRVAIVIDDSEAVRSKVAHWLGKKGFEVLQASNGEEGLEQIKENQEQLYLMVCDFNMPKMNGGELLKRLEEEKIGTHILKVLLSTETPNAKLLNFNTISNFKCWLLKPLDEQTFIKSMERIGTF